MITSIDTSVLSDIFLADPTFSPRSMAALRRCRDEGALVVSDIVLAEFASALADPSSAVTLLDGAGIRFGPAREEASVLAGAAWRQYRGRGGSRERLIPDFLVAAHAATQADRLLTRDPRVPRTYFPALRVVEPTSS